MNPACIIFIVNDNFPDLSKLAKKRPNKRLYLKNGPAVFHEI